MLWDPIQKSILFQEIYVARLHKETWEHEQQPYFFFFYLFYKDIFTSKSKTSCQKYLSLSYIVHYL